VAIKKLKQIHAATHPGASLESLTARDDDEQLPLLAAEDLVGDVDADE
jgi:hypothetical protein